MRGVWITVLLGAWLIASAAGATVLMSLSVADLTATSRLVTRATVIATRGEKDARNGRLYTYVTLRAGQALKGTPPARFVVRQFGGEADGLAMHVAGMPRFQAGQEMLLFLDQAKGFYFVKGMSQGAYTIVRENGVEMAKQDPAGAGVAAPNPLTGKLEVRESAPRSLPLSDLVSEIKRNLGASK